jgi:hypothetical protein
MVQIVGAVQRTTGDDKKAWCGFVAARLFGAAATATFRWLVPSMPASVDRVVGRTDTEEVP